MSSKSFGDKRLRRGSWRNEVVSLAEAAQYVPFRVPEDHEPTALWDFFTCPGVPPASYCTETSLAHPRHSVKYAMGVCENCGEKYSLVSAIGHHGFCTDWCMRQYEKS